MSSHLLPLWSTERMKSPNLVRKSFQTISSGLADCEGEVCPPVSYGRPILIPPCPRKQNPHARKIPWLRRSL
uniref:Uncharacterized protein n=1 Tax=Bionectria ochroleuca TaxID=29856 RepID=A0A0B7JSQ2_BIOOC